jgi:signal transduction histidine kinase
LGDEPPTCIAKYFMEKSRTASVGGESAGSTPALRTIFRTPAEMESEIARLNALTLELQENARELRVSLDGEAAANLAKMRFLASMSHELRTPLNAIMGFSDILKGEVFGPVGSPRYREYAAHIHDSGSHLLDLINDILDIAKLDAAKVELHESEMDVQDVVASCISLLEVQSIKGGVTVSVGEPRKRVKFRGDERRVRQILLNLLSNAVKFTPEGGDVTITAFLKAGGLTIAVADTGIGIAAHDIPRALERFGQIDSAMGRKHTGTGLGLPLAKELTELHGGALTIESELGTGTTVTVTFPPARVIA